MKKILLALGLIVAMGITSAFAGEIKILPKIAEAFKKDFSSATEVNWETRNDYYKAAFTMYDQKIFAYYSLEGDLISITRYISSLQLPLQVLTQLKNNYSHYWIRDLFEVSNSEGTHYYVTLENANSILILKSTNSSSWKSYSRKIKI